MAPGADHSRQEFWDENGKPFLKEYVGSGKLEGKKALITGGDSVWLPGPMALEAVTANWFM
jgi:hypothetical protein